MTSTDLAPAEGSAAGGTSILPQPATILTALGQAAFVWDLASDTLAWTDQIGEMLQDIPAATLATGAGYATLIEPSREIRQFLFKYGRHDQCTSVVFFLPESDGEF